MSYIRFIAFINNSKLRYKSVHMTRLRINHVQKNTTKMKETNIDKGEKGQKDLKGKERKRLG
jgi:hypothetical protein